jgi:hypothetical protein
MALIASGLIVSGSILPSVVKADTNSLAQLFPALVGVQLTPTQQTQLESLRNQTLPQMQNLLSPEQQKLFNTALSEGKGVRIAAQSLELSITQRLQMRKILRPLRSQIDTILTPAQKQQVEQNIQALQQQGR